MAKKVLWCSKHELGDEQSEAVKHMVCKSGEDAIYDYRLVVWSSSKSEEDDNAENAYTWVELAAQYDAVVGVFPPSALVGLWLARDEADCGNEDFQGVRRLKILTPIANVYYTFAKTRKEFEFLRMQEL